jgi:hypothetical protein
VIGPDHAGYDGSRAVPNGLIDNRPDPATSRPHRKKINPTPVAGSPVSHWRFPRG